MTHPNEGTLQAYLDHALSAEDAAGVAGHLEHCPACRAELESLARAAAAFAAALAVLDAPSDVAVARAAVVRRAARSADPVRIGPVVRPLRRAFLRAAMLILATAAVAAAAIPGTPLHRWIVDAWRESVARVVGTPPSPAPTARVPEAAPAPPTAGVSVLPAGDRVRIAFDHLAPETVVQVRLVDREEAAVEASGPAASARFKTGPGRIEMVGGGAGDVRVEVPRSVGRASVESDGRLLLFKEGGSIRVFSPADTVGQVLRFRPAR